MPRHRGVALFAAIICATFGVVIAGAVRTDASVGAVNVLQLPRDYVYSAISQRSPLNSVVLFGRSRENAKKCVDVTVEVQIPPRLSMGAIAPTSCSQSLGSTLVVPVFSALNGTLDGSSVHVLTLNSAKNQVVLGPTLMTYTELSDNKVETTSAAGSLWIYLCNTTNGPELLRVSDVNGTVLNVIRMPSICRTVVSSSAKGFSMRPTFNTGSSAGSVIGVYDVAPGSDTSVLARRCTMTTGAWTC